MFKNFNKVFYKTILILHSIFILSILNNNIFDFFTKLNYCFSIENTFVNLSTYINSYKVLLTFSIVFFYLFIFFINKNIIKYSKNIVNIFYIIITISSLILFLTENILTFFISYEAVLIPSAFIVFFFSPNRRSYLVTLYFLMWTQLGSFLVLISISIIQVINLSYNFNQLYFSGFNSSHIATILIFFGFGIKIPIWPFYFWLTKTHVEANTSFSIFLSGILVKTALIGFTKFSILFLNYINIIFFIILIGIIDVTLKLNYQVDFKKLTAYLTVQEMCLLVIFSFFLNNKNYLFFFKFMYLHTSLSGCLFFFSELIYSRKGSRQLNISNGILTNKPVLSLMYYMLILLFIGVPFTLKFFIEIIMIFKIISYDFFIFSNFLIFIQLLTVLFFFKNTIVFLFLSDFDNKQDLSKVEFTIFIMVILPMLSFFIF